MHCTIVSRYRIPAVRSCMMLFYMLLDFVTYFIWKGRQAILLLFSHAIPILKLCVSPAVMYIVIVECSVFSPCISLAWPSLVMHFNVLAYVVRNSMPNLVLLYTVSFGLIKTSLITI